jgi:membrane-anchored glycerophosphoryl diester phosphodiesterase (GDPDase)
MVVPIAVGLASGTTGNLTADASNGTLSDSQVVSLLVALGGLLAGTELQSIGLLFVSGMIAHVTSAAAVGRRLTMSEAWAATRGKRWRLLGLSFLLGLGVVVVVGLAIGVVVLVAVVGNAPLGSVVGLSILLGVLLVIGYLLFWVRMRALAVPALMLEPVGIFGAIRRAVRLTRRQFWRLLGLLLLVSLVVGVAGAILRAPFSIAGQVVVTGSTATGSGLLVYLLLTAVGTVISSAVLQPFTAAVSALLYIDQRIRKEAFDVELLGRAGILPS